MSPMLTWGEWISSPGFGGLAAVLAAGIAYLGVARTLRIQRATTRKQQWWERARWALDLMLSDDTTTRAVGLEMLQALSTSEYEATHEFDIVEAAITPVLAELSESSARTTRLRRRLSMYHTDMVPRKGGRDENA